MSCSDIYINGRFLTHPMTGINRFAYEICKALKNIVDFVIIVPEKSIHSDYDISDFTVKEYGLLKSHLWEQIDLFRFLKKQNSPLLLSFSGIGPILYKNKITTIHDVSFLHNPKWFSKSYYRFYKIITPIAIKTSLHLLTVSEFSKSEIIKFYPTVSIDKIEVIYNAVNCTNIHNPNIDVANRSNYLLTVGSFDPRKNLGTLLKGMSLPKMRNEMLHVVGGGNRVFGKLEDYSCRDNIQFLGRLSDEELATEYSKAKLFILPSLYEGFGIPPLEALCAGCDIAISDISVFKEIFEDAAIYFNPESPEDIVDKIQGYLNGSISISSASKSKVLNKFSWHSSALKIKSIISLYTKN